MVLDKQNTLSAAQAITATANSTNTIDLGAPGTVPGGGTMKRDAGGGYPVGVLAQVVTTFSGGTSVQAQLVESDSANLSSPSVLNETAAIPVASLVAGYKFPLGTIPPGASKRYIGLRYVVVGTPTAGAVTAGLVMDQRTA